MEAERVEFYSELTRYELIDLFYTVNGNVTDNITVLITTLFAYLALAYIAGKKLSKFQVISIATIYCKSSDDLGHIASRTKGDICSIAFA